MIYKKKHSPVSVNASSKLYFSFVLPAFEIIAILYNSSVPPLNKFRDQLLENRFVLSQGWLARVIIILKKE